MEEPMAHEPSPEKADALPHKAKHEPETASEDGAQVTAEQGEPAIAEKKMPAEGAAQPQSQAGAARTTPEAADETADEAVGEAAMTPEAAAGGASAAAPSGRADAAMKESQQPSAGQGLAAPAAGAARSDTAATTADPSQEAEKQKEQPPAEAGGAPQAQDAVVKTERSKAEDAEDAASAAAAATLAKHLRMGPEESLIKADLDAASGRWSKAEDESLRLAVEQIGPKNWKRIASEYLADTRTDVQCLHRWQKVLRPGLVKGPWQPVEDETIRDCMSRGITRWSEIAKRVPGRIGKQCRERWFNHLDPHIKKGEWTAEEDAMLIKGQQELGNKWSKIAKLYLPGRPENAVKNRWNAAARRHRTGDPKYRHVNTSALVAAATSTTAPTSGGAGAGSKKRRVGPKSAHEKQKAVSTEGLEGMHSLASLCAVALHDTIPGEPSRLSKEEKKAKREAEKAAKKAEKKRLKEAEREAKKEAKKAAKKAAKEEKKRTKKRTLGSVTAEAVNEAACMGAAALLAAAGELQEASPSKKRLRGSSFMASRPNLPAPESISTVGNKPGADMKTPSFANPANAQTNISPTTKASELQSAKPVEPQQGAKPAEQAGAKAAAQHSSSGAADALHFLSSLANAKQE